MHFYIHSEIGHREALDEEHDGALRCDCFLHIYG